MTDHEEDIVIRGPRDARKDPIDWANVGEDELRERAAVFSFEAADAKGRLVDTDRWIAVITAHIYIDHILTQLLSENLRNADAILAEGRRKYVLEKLEICEAMDWIGGPFSTVIRKLNSLRNNLAHNLVFDLPKQTELDVIRMMPSEFQKLAEEVHKPSDEAPTPPFGRHLQVFLVMLDLHRQQVLRQNYLSRHRNREMGKAMQNARALLESLDQEKQ